MNIVDPTPEQRERFGLAAEAAETNARCDEAIREAAEDAAQYRKNFPETVEATPEQRTRFQREFAGIWAQLNHSPHDHMGDRAQLEGLWILARAYSEQLQNEFVSSETLSKESQAKR